MNPILPLFERSSNLINQNPVTSVDKLVCTFDKRTSYAPCASARSCVRARVCVHLRNVLHMYKVCAHARALFCHCINIMYHSYFIVYRTITLPTVLLLFVYVKLLSLSERITQTNDV